MFNYQVQQTLNTRLTFSIRLGAKEKERFPSCLSLFPLRFSQICLLSTEFCTEHKNGTTEFWVLSLNIIPWAFRFHAEQDIFLSQIFTEDEVEVIEDWGYRWSSWFGFPNVTYRNSYKYLWLNGRDSILVNFYIWFDFLCSFRVKYACKRLDGTNWSNWLGCCGVLAR